MIIYLNGYDLHFANVFNPTLFTLSGALYLGRFARCRFEIINLYLLI
jgi:hypothetical protein